MRRHELPNFSLLDNNVSDTVLENILNLVNCNPNRNDLGQDNYKISQNCPLPEMFGNTYKQILLQHQLENDNPSDEKTYVHWQDGTDEIKSYLENKFKRVYRTRIAITPANHSLDWHIDTDTSVLCRIQIAANSSNSVFEINRKNNIESIAMNKGECWFINVGWNHRVVNGSGERIVLIAGVDYENLHLHGM